MPRPTSYAVFCLKKKTSQRVDFDQVQIVLNEDPDVLLAIDQALTRSEGFDPVLTRVVELRIFGGLDWNETAEALAIPPSTLRKRCEIGTLWLEREMEGLK